MKQYIELPVNISKTPEIEMLLSALQARFAKVSTTEELWDAWTLTTLNKWMKRLHEYIGEGYENQF